MLEAIAPIRRVTDKPLSAQPHPGIPRNVEGRNIYLCSPEYMASYARKFVNAGVAFVGGCCGTTPEHTRAMKSSLRATDIKGRTGGFQVMTERQREPDLAPAPLALRSSIGRKLAAGEFLNLFHNLKCGLDMGGNPIGTGPGFVIGVGANPGIINIDAEIRRFEYKVEAGADYAVTQPVFDIGLLETFLRRIEHCRIPVLAGIWPLVSVRNAEFMKNELRVSVPDSIVERMARAANAESARAEGIQIAREMLQQVHGLVQGAQVAAPIGRYSSAIEVLEVESPASAGK